MEEAEAEASGHHRSTASLLHALGRAAALVPILDLLSDIVVLDHLCQGGPRAAPMLVGGALVLGWRATMLYAAAPPAASLLAILLPSSRACDDARKREGAAAEPVAEPSRLVGELVESSLHPVADRSYTTLVSVLALEARLLLLAPASGPYAIWHASLALVLGEARSESRAGREAYDAAAASAAALLAASAAFHSAPQLLVQSWIYYGAPFRTDGDVASATAEGGIASGGTRVEGGSEGVAGAEGTPPLSALARWPEWLLADTGGPRGMATPVFALSAALSAFALLLALGRLATADRATRGASGDPDAPSSLACCARILSPNLGPTGDADGGGGGGSGDDVRIEVRLPLASALAEVPTALHQCCRSIWHPASAPGEPAAAEGDGGAARTAAPSCARSGGSGDGELGALPQLPRIGPAVRAPSAEQLALLPVAEAEANGERLGEDGGRPPAAERKRAGASASELRDAGYTLAELWDAGYSVPALRGAAFTPRRIKSHQVASRRRAYVKATSPAGARTGESPAGSPSHSFTRSPNHEQEQSFTHSSSLDESPSPTPARDAPYVALPSQRSLGVALRGAVSGLLSGRLSPKRGPPESAAGGAGAPGGVLNSERSVGREGRGAHLSHKQSSRPPILPPPCRSLHADAPAVDGSHTQEGVSD
jgi:hypothetical protein